MAPADLRSKSLSWPQFEAVIEVLHVLSSDEILSNAAGVLLALFNRTVDVLLPQHCFVCGAGSEGQAVCSACGPALPRRPATACRVCALPALDGGVCGSCVRQPPAYDATRAIFDYAFPVDAMVQALKYRHQLAMARFFAAEMQDVAMDFLQGVDLLLPMPLHPRRLAGRGFNQAVEMARPLAKAASVALAIAHVSKTRDTPAQATLGRDERLRSPRGTFACDRDLHGLRIAVLDDVMTTGATLDELARCLKRQGAQWVGNLVLARTPAPY